MPPDEFVRWCALLKMRETIKTAERNPHNTNSGGSTNPIDVLRRRGKYQPKR